jgi:hypothetical protein
LVAIAIDVREERKGAFNGSDVWKDMMTLFNRYDRVDDEAESFLEKLEEELSKAELEANQSHKEAIVDGAAAIPQIAPPEGWRGISAALDPEAAELPELSVRVSSRGRTIKPRRDQLYEYENAGDGDAE